MLQICFWGARGSITSPGTDTSEFGGNTTCLEIRADDRLVIVDFGSGVRALGDYMTANVYKNGPVKTDIFLTHTHLDHIIGFPMFVPFFDSKNEFHIYGPKLPEGGYIQDVLNLITSYQFWPVRLCEFSAKLIFDTILESTIDLGGGLEVISTMLNHPVITLGYRFNYKGKSIVIMTDHEPFYNIFGDKDNPLYSETADYEGEETAIKEKKKISDFADGADILIYDSPYNESEYLDGHQGWGHSFYEGAVKLAITAKVKKLVFFHHEPSKSDKDLRDTEMLYSKKVSNLEIVMAKEKSVLTA
ncbi:MAG: MBL fold metallo-hydrolase [Treponema sp.]|nr:MBL fold metallo-hydrolase [Treponema sp.]